MKRPVLLTFAIVSLMVSVWYGFQQGNTKLAGTDTAQKKAAISPSSKAPTSADAKASATGTTAPTPESRYVEIMRQCEAVFAITNATERKAAFDQLLAATTDPAGWKAILETMNRMFQAGRVFEDEWDSFWHVIAHRDPQAAIALIESYGPAEKWYGGAVRRSIQEWASADPAAAMRWLQNNQALTGKALDAATVNLINGYAGRDLPAATRYALNVIKPDDPLFGDAAYALTRNALQQGGVEGLKSWFRALPDNAVKQKAFQAVGAQLGQIDLEQKRIWLVAEAGSPYRNDQTYREFIGAMAQTDPKGAMDLAFSLPTSPHEPGVTVGVGYASFEWLMQDPAAFSAYYHSLPTPAQQNQIVYALKNALKGPELPPKKRNPATQFLQGLP